MKIMSRMALVSLCVGLAALTAGVANARTPSPTATGTPMPPATATLTPPPAATPTPLPEASFSGGAYIDAHVSRDPVTAKIGGVLCGTAIFMAPPGGGPFYIIEVASEQAISGCGREGATITFFVGEREAPQTAVWHAGESQRLNLIIGPPFAQFQIGTAGVVPYVGDTVCGRGAIVYSNEQEPGCGVEGTTVTFKLVDAQGNVSVFATGVWHAWDGISIPQPINLISGSSGAIGLPGTGNAPTDNGRPGNLLISLGFVGLAATGLGLALRRRAVRR